MAALQLSFSFRTSSSCKTVHLLGNWDGYKGQLPLSKDASGKPGAWKGTFRFQGATLQQGKRYWYYYIIDGYKVSHDDSQPSTVEPTTKRTLNILDIPSAKGDKPALSVNTSARSAKDSKRQSTSKRDSTHGHVPQGRSLSPSKIVSPRPSKPHEARRLANARYSNADVDKLSRSVARTNLSNSSFSSSEDDGESDYSDSEIESDASSDLPSLTSNSSRGSPCSPRSPGSPASSVCSCDRWGTTKRGDRVKLDCGGSRCGSDASSDSEDEYVRDRAKLDARRGDARRHGVVVRHSRR